MLLTIPSDISSLAPFLDRFLDLIGRDRWFKRCDQLDDDQRRSPFQGKIVADYHWLEMAIAFQADVLSKDGHLSAGRADEFILTALNFAASTVEVHAQLSPQGRNVLEGRLRDSLKAKTGFAPIYLEIDLAQRLMDSGYDVEFRDIEGSAQYDLLFRRGSFVGEVECKSLSADAGRQIHRKDFYRFMEAITPALREHAELKRQEVLVVSLDARLPSNTVEMNRLVQSTASFLRSDGLGIARGPGFRLERHLYTECLGEAPIDNQKAFYKACDQTFGENTHVAGGLTIDGGCVVVMRSDRQDDPSKPKLEALRKAASQFTGERPSFIAIQEHGIDPADLMLPHVRRKAGILSYALFGHYGATHVNATYITGFGAVVERGGGIGTPAFAIPNPKPKFPLSAADAAPFLLHISDVEFAAAIGEPLPAENISVLPIDPPNREP